MIEIAAGWTWWTSLRIRSQAAATVSGRDLRAVAVEQDQLCAAGEEAGRTRLVDLDMRVPVAQDRAIGRAQRRERKAVGGGAGRHPQGADLRSEQVRESAVEPSAPLVAVIRRVEPVRCGYRLDHLRVRGGRIVGEKAHGGGSEAHSPSHGKRRVIGSRHELRERFVSEPI